jgi:two-component system, NtrC family, sensor kinase
MDAEAIQRKLTAAEKTIAALMRRVESQLGDGTNAFAALVQNVALERIVQDKTQELEVQRSQLQQALADLRLAQGELLQAQKLESVGRLAAGVAHEINTPVQFVSDSMFFLREAFSDLLPIAEAFGSLRAAAEAGPVPGDLLAQAEAVDQAADLAYLVENVPPALARCGEGLERVAAIVRALKEFAHPDSRRTEPADLNHALETTLVITRNEYKLVADVETSLGEIPAVRCLAGELNQVFLNLVVNAAHAIEEARGGQGRGLIRVSTRRDGDHVVISVGDDGAGIPEAIRTRVFDPFFTTKAVGKGSGQGLSIARNVVVEKHGGTIDFESEVGKGTVFHVRLPIEGPASPTPA